MARIRHIVFHSMDPEALAKFYVEVMGLKILHRASNGGISLTDGYMNLSIHTNKIDGKPPGFNHFGFVVDDLDAVHERAVAAGATEVFAPRDVSGMPRVSTILDPSGNLINLYQDA